MTVDKCSVQVAVRIRPPSAKEKAKQEKLCVTVMPDRPQVFVGDKSFTFDYAFEQDTETSAIYDQCVKDLVNGIFDGYNATVLAYGQTGSGKTFTMGTSFDSSSVVSGSQKNVGIIPLAAQHLFKSMEERKSNAEDNGQHEPTFEVSVQFIELYNEDLYDLLGDQKNPTAIRIKENQAKNEIYVDGTVPTSVNSADEIMQVLLKGAANRTTIGTNMNQSSSRSHAIFSVFVKQVREEKENANSVGGRIIHYLNAKLHFVDLAGSERMKRTGAIGERAKECISINGGLLALANVISTLGGGIVGRVLHVPYRDSKLTRLLQDSLGGNSRTLMIACASPCLADFSETTSTLGYANRTKNIKNKVVANQHNRNRGRQTRDNNVGQNERSANIRWNYKKVDCGANLFKRVPTYQLNSISRKRQSFGKSRLPVYLRSNNCGVIPRRRSIAKVDNCQKLVDLKLQVDRLNLNNQKLMQENEQLKDRIKRLEAAERRREKSEKERERNAKAAEIKLNEVERSSNITERRPRKEVRFVSRYALQSSSKATPVINNVVSSDASAQLNNPLQRHRLRTRMPAKRRSRSLGSKVGNGGFFLPICLLPEAKTPQPKRMMEQVNS